MCPPKGGLYNNHIVQLFRGHYTSASLAKKFYPFFVFYIDINTLLVYTIVLNRGKPLQDGALQSLCPCLARSWLVMVKRTYFGYPHPPAAAGPPSPRGRGLFFELIAAACPRTRYAEAGLQGEGCFS